MVLQVLNGSLAGHNGLDEESEHGEHSLHIYITCSSNCNSLVVAGQVVRCRQDI